MADDGLGPISYVIVEFPGSKMTGEGLPILVDLVDRGIIRILDLMFVTRGDDGSVAVIDVSDIDGDGDLDLTIFEGATSGILDESDAADAANAIEPGSSAAILIFENHWAAPFMQAVHNGGGQAVAAGYIPMDDIIASLDAVESQG